MAIDCLWSIEVDQNWKVRKNQKCGPEEFYCEDATCIHKDMKCNNLFNCRSRFDEEGCK
ncbi:hypothetical protein NQ314_018160, partial [Rhamnusium bicolor]